MPDLAGTLLSANLWPKHPNEKAEVVKEDKKQYLISWLHAAYQEPILNVNIQIY